jgi:hypothetical protein
VTTDLKARILDAAHATPSPARDASRVFAWLVLPSSVIVAAALFFAFDGVSHGQGRPLWFYVASSIGWAAVASLSMWAALARGASAVGRPRPWLLAVAIGTPAVLFAMMFALAVAYPEVTALHPERLGLKCLGLTVAAAAFPLLALALMRRGSDPVHPLATGAALGAACGASAGVMVEMWCPVAAPRHIVVGHVAPMLVMAIIGAMLGARIIAIRPRAQSARQEMGAKSISAR